MIFVPIGFGHWLLLVLYKAQIYDLQALRFRELFLFFMPALSLTDHLTVFSVISVISFIAHDDEERAIASDRRSRRATT